MAAVKIFSQSRAPQRLPRTLVEKLVKGFFALFPKIKKVRHNLRTRGRNCLRTRALGRRLLVTRPWCLRRRRKSRRSAKRTLRWCTWSWTIACGGASGSQLASNIAGGWPLPMGPRLAMPSCGRRGSSAEGQGDVLGTTVDTWSASVPGAYAVFFFFSTRRRTRILRSSVLHSGVSANHAEWRSAHSRSFSCLPCFRTWNLDITV